MTPTEYYRFLRLLQTKRLLQNSTYRVSEIRSVCGFNNPESLARAYKKQFVLTASDAREPQL